MSYDIGFRDEAVRPLETSDPLAGGDGGCFSSDCYWSNDGQVPNISDVQRDFLHDGTRFQNQPFETQYPMIFKLFFSDANIKHIGDVVLASGFNSRPTREELSGFMNQVYTDDMPYGAYNIRDPQRNNRSVGYVDYYLRRLNNELLQKVLRSMSVIKSSRLQYLRDISGFQGPLEIVRPIYTECKGAGPTLDMSVHLLPPPPDGVEPKPWIDG